MGNRQDWEHFVVNSGGFFSHFSANIGKFIFRNLEFKEKILEFRKKYLSLDEKFGILVQKS